MPEQEDLSLGNWNFTIAEMKNFSEAKLFEVMRQNAGGSFDAWARAELARRQNLEIKAGIAGLTGAITSLTSSSERLEKLTRVLIRLTVVLIVLTFFAACVLVGVEIWKAYHPTVMIISAGPKK